MLLYTSLNHTRKDKEATKMCIQRDEKQDFREYELLNLGKNYIFFYNCIMIANNVIT